MAEVKLNPNNRKHIKNQVLVAKHESYRFWRVYKANPSTKNLLAFASEYAVYRRMWLLYQSLFLERVGRKPKRIENYVCMDG